MAYDDHQLQLWWIGTRSTNHFIEDVDRQADFCRIGLGSILSRCFTESILNLSNWSYIYILMVISMELVHFYMWHVSLSVETYFKGITKLSFCCTCFLNMLIIYHISYIPTLIPFFIIQMQSLFEYFFSFSLCHSFSFPVIRAVSYVGIYREK